MALEWPWGVADPLNPLRAVAYFSRFFEEPWHELYGGALILVPDMPRSYVPTLMALKLPEIFVALALGGAAGALVGELPARALAEPARDPPAGRAGRVAADRGHRR